MPATGRIRRNSLAPGVIRRTGGVLAAGLLVVLVSLAGALPAAAHNTLTGSDPADGSTLDTAPTSVTLTFDQAVQNYQPVITVTGPNGNRFTDGAAEVDGSAVSVGMTAGPAGEYTAAYRIVSADGHPVTGAITFTLAEQAAGPATGVAPEGGQAGTSNPDDAGSSGLGIWLWIGIGLAVVLVIAAIVVILRKPGAEQD